MLRNILHQFRSQKIALVEGDELWLVLQSFAIGLQLVLHDLPGGDGVISRRVYEMNEHAAALDMPEETVADPHAL